MPSASGWPDDGHVHAMLLREGEQRREIIRVDGKAFHGHAILRQSLAGDARVAGRAAHLRDARRLRELPDEGVFASAAADDE